MSQPSYCPKCGTSLPADAPAGLCPKCLLQAGFESQGLSDPGSTAASPASGGFDAPAIGELAARFPQLEIIELLGKGGMGAVYKARQRALDRLVAVKILPPEVSADKSFTDRFAREARALAGLNHPNIVSVHECGEKDGLFYFVMEFVDGPNLRQMLQSGLLAPEQALAIVSQICDALQYAHDEGVVHRDIKPENILLDKRGRVKIADFGLSKLLRHDRPELSLTGEHQVMGTLRYMAPEQMHDTKAVDHRADIYSLGVVFYELLTGQVPMGRFAPPSQKVQIDVRFDEIVLRALEEEPARRYQQASEIKTQVETIGGIAPEAMQSVYRALGREYKSKASIFGLPLLHVATGIDPRTGRKRIAKGVVAMGDVAIGVIASGGLAMGGLTFGGMSLGLVSLGGVSLGLLLAVGGVAVGSVAFGGMAVGVVSVGGAAAGYYAYGGQAWAVHAADSASADPQAAQFFEGWAARWAQSLAVLGFAVPIAGAVLSLLMWLALGSRRSTSGLEPRDSEQDNSVSVATSSGHDPGPTTAALPPYARDAAFLIGGALLLFTLRFAIGPVHLWFPSFLIAGVLLLYSFELVRRVQPALALLICGTLLVVVAIMLAESSSLATWLVLELQGAAAVGSGDVAWLRAALLLLAIWLAIETAGVWQRLRRAG